MRRTWLSAGLCTISLQVVCAGSAPRRNAVGAKRIRRVRGRQRADHPERSPRRIPAAALDSRPDLGRGRAGPAHTGDGTRARRRALRRRTGLQPHLIISHLHRIKLDPNREIVEAAQGNPQAEQAWDEFHGWITAARAAVTTQFAAGLYLDVHGHGHPNNWTELGYALSATDPGAAQLLAQPTLRHQRFDHPVGRLRARQRVLRRPAGFAQLRRNARGRRLRRRPQSLLPRSRRSFAYFTGGYNVRTHGSRNGGTVDGVQFELHFSARETLGPARGLHRRAGTRHGDLPGPSTTASA